MNNLVGRKMLSAVASTAFLAACAASGGAPNAPTAAAPSIRIADDAKTYNLSGEYAGTIKDNKNGTGKAHMTLSESKGALGGTLAIKGNPTVADISWIANGLRVDGTSVFIASSGYCTFTHTSTYNLKTRVLTGSYKNVYGCSGEKGTYALKQACYYKGTSDAAIDREVGPKPC